MTYYELVVAERNNIEVPFVANGTDVLSEDTFATMEQAQTSLFHYLWSACTAGNIKILTMNEGLADYNIPDWETQAFGVVYEVTTDLVAETQVAIIYRMTDDDDLPPLTTD